VVDAAVSAYRAALKEHTRERVPLLWARTQTSLGNALQMLGQRQRGREKLKEAAATYREALKELTRERVPLDWAGNLGNALATIGEREAGTASLEEAVAAYREALEEYTRERIPLQWATCLGNQGVAIMLIADRTNDAAAAELAVAQIETAYDTLDDGDHVQGAAIFQAQLPRAQAIRDRLKGK
jgi:tetratricopeptide (TPR) repeat protein